jgi:hypothetical protein
VDNAAAAKFVNRLKKLLQDKDNPEDKNDFSSRHFFKKVEKLYLEGI